MRILTELIKIISAVILFLIMLAVVLGIILTLFAFTGGAFLIVVFLLCFYACAPINNPKL